MVRIWTRCGLSPTERASCLHPPSSLPMSLTDPPCSPGALLSATRRTLLRRCATMSSADSSSSSPCTVFDGTRLTAGKEHTAISFDQTHGGVVLWCAPHALHGCCGRLARNPAPSVPLALPPGGAASSCLSTGNGTCSWPGPPPHEEMAGTLRPCPSPCPLLTSRY